MPATTPMRYPAAGAIDVITFDHCIARVAPVILVAHAHSGQDVAVELWQNIVLIAATVTSGLTAGLLFAFACSVMPGLRHTDDRTYVRSFQVMDTAIVSNVFFLVAFAGAPVLTFIALVLHLGGDVRTQLGWIVAALGFSLASIAITRVVHLPLNAAIQAVGDPDQVADLPAVRERFEARWVRWNVIRTMTSTAALGCLSVAVAL